MEKKRKDNYRLLLIAKSDECLAQISDLISENDITSSDSVEFKLVHFRTVSEGLGVLVKEIIDLVILDVEEPEPEGFETVKSFIDERFDVPLVVLTGSDDIEFGIKAVELGAQDYLIKSTLRSDILQRSVRYALERYRLVRELKRRTLVDDLTGLYNRRGFFYLGEHALSLAERNSTKQFVMFADLDGLKLVNDTGGHEAGDEYLLQAANFLRQVFRGSDIIARIGGDEFAVIAQAVSKESIVSVRRRFEKGLDNWNATSKNVVPLSLSVGIVFADKPSPESLDSLLAAADYLMYREKAAKK